MESNRVKDWDLRLVAAVPAELAKPFDWVRANCGHLIVAAVVACHGKNHPIAKELRGLSSQAKVLAHPEARGGLDAILGEYFQPLPSVLQARDGDVGVLGSEGVYAGGVVLDGVFVARSESRPGGFRVPVKSMAKAFRV